jgi:germination protein M
MAKKKRTRRSASHSAIGCLFWACLIAVVAAAAIAAREPLKEALGKLFAQIPASAPTLTVKPLAQTDSQTPVNPPETVKPAESVGGAAVEHPPVTPLQVDAPKQEASTLRKTHLFFATVGVGGTIELKGVIRPIPASDSPLKDTIQTLLKGPTSQEINQGMLSMIPADSRLLGVTLRGETAFIDFSESFRFNTLGTEGLDAQLRQIVYAATEFPTVKNVQILIEGKKVQYLGGEGIRIDAPLARTSFKD